MSELIYSIAIDGPSGSGKSTLAKMLSQKLNIAYLDTGAMYRSVGLYCRDNNVDISKEEEVSAIVDKIDIKIEWSEDGQVTFLNGKDVSTLIRGEEIGRMGSTVAVYKDVRIMLVKLQQEIAKTNCIVMDGRDIGTYVLPSAEVKIYLDASAITRATRRYNELDEKGVEVDFDTILQDIIERDNRDKNREIAPLVQADDAIYMDTSAMTFEEVLEEVESLINKIIFKSIDMYR